MVVARKREHPGCTAPADRIHGRVRDSGQAQEAEVGYRQLVLIRVEDFEPESVTLLTNALNIINMLRTWAATVGAVSTEVP